MSDLGHEPPLSVAGESGPVDRRRVSLRWLSATVLTGLCGAALMGGAVYGSLEGATHFAAVPERVRETRPDPGAIRTARKADRLGAATEQNTARQVFKVSTTTRMGEREIIRVRPFVRVSANLSTSISPMVASLPAFNPMRMIQDAGDWSSASPGAEPEAEVTVVMRDIATLGPRLRSAASIGPDQILAAVRAAAEIDGVSTPLPPVALMPRLGTTAFLADARFGQAADPTADYYDGIDVRITEENVSFVGKTPAEASGALEERIIVLRRGDTVASMLQPFAVTPEDVRAILSALGPRGREAFAEGARVRLLVEPAPAPRRARVLRVTIVGDGGPEAIVAQSDAGRWVTVDVVQPAPEPEATEDDDDDPSIARLYHSLYETALRHDVPRRVIDDLVRIYSFDVDFSRRVQPGDSFEVFYGAEDESGAAGPGEVLFAALTLGGDRRRYYRFTTPEDQIVDFYDETGKSARMFLMRKPLTGGVFRSGFGMRRHPLLRYARMHNGVDWSADIGTPIYSAGNGTVTKAEWDGGFGRRVEIQHANGYVTTYSHLSGFARGIREGVRVRQGQVIGYLGNSGLSTGPHLHYEVLVNARYVDPMRIRLPRGRTLEGRALAEFERERNRIDGLMRTGPTGARVAEWR